MKLRILILGGGVGGLSTAFFLGARGDVEVTLVEREPAHDRHSSGRSAEILRTAIDDGVTRELACASAAWLRAPEAIGLQCSGPLVDDRGLVVITDAKDADWVGHHVAAGLAREIPMDELRAAAPMFQPKGSRAFRMEQGGRIQRGELLRSLAHGAAARGVRMLRSVGRAEPLLERGRVAGATVETKDGPLDVACDRLVVAAGAWSGGIARDLGAPLPLRTTRRHMFVAAGDPAPPADLPVIWDDAAGFYVRPEPSATGPMTWAFSSTDLDEFRWDSRGMAPTTPYAVDEDIRAAALRQAQERLGGGPLEVVNQWRGFRDLTPDDRPIIGADPRVNDLYWCAGLGGHGMTVSLGVGSAAAAAALGRSSTEDERCSPARFPL